MIRIFIFWTETGFQRPRMRHNRVDYKELSLVMHSKIDVARFRPIFEGLSLSLIESAVFLSLAEKWWDTIRTFHF